MTSYKTPLARVRRLGSAKTGTEHWWLQRVTVAALVPLTYFILKLFDLCLNASYQDTIVWIAASTYNSVGLTAWIIVAFYHAAMGLQVVIEDYVSGEGRKIIFVWLVNFTFLLLGLTALMAIFRIITIG